MKVLMVIFSFIIMSFFSQVFANERGNGGGTVVCKNGQKEIVSISLLDQYNWGVLNNLTFEASYQNDNELIDLAFTRLSQVGSFNFLKKLKRELDTVEENSRFLPVGAGVIPANDGLTIMNLPQNCELVYMVEYRTINGVDFIMIDNDIFAHDLFTPMLKGSLKLHEAVYALLRKSVAPNKQNSLAQEITALLSADQLTYPQEDRLRSLTNSNFMADLGAIRLVARKNMKLESKLDNILFMNDLLFTTKIEKGATSFFIYDPRSSDSSWYFVPSKLKDTFEIQAGDEFVVKNCYSSSYSYIYLAKVGTSELLNLSFSGNFDSLDQLDKMGLFEVVAE